MGVVRVVVCVVGAAVLGVVLLVSWFIFFIIKSSYI